MRLDVNFVVFCQEMFLTQKCSQNGQNTGQNYEEYGDSFLGLDPGNFSSPCISLLGSKENETNYLDISDEEDVFEQQNDRYGDVTI